MPAATRASASKAAAAKPAPATTTTTATASNKRKATTSATKEGPAKKVAVTPTKKETRTAPATKKAAATATTKTETKKPAGKKGAKEEDEDEEDEDKEVKQPIANKAAEKKATEKASSTPKKAPAAAATKSKATAPPAEKEKAKGSKGAAADKKEDTNNKDEDDNEDNEDSQQLMDDTVLLKDIDSSADEDSSDDETEEDRAAMKEDSFATLKDEISLTPKAAAALRKKLDNLGKPKDNSTTGVVYLGRIPHGFYEEQMTAYFSQFGKVLRLRLSRNKKTGKSKHYAFIEFSSPEVADIVAETMNNYLLFGHLLKCKSLEPHQIHPALFQGANKKFKAIPWLKISKEKHNAEKTPQQLKQTNRKLLKNEAAKRAKLEKLGIDYDFPGYKASVQEKPKHIKF
ncbi:MKI67 FHA domain-interacting nucleolar phosphoprotein [Mortierella sp. NVP85]|nr:MKI67 FHA domain-interacting nucleolar phosphoprotein [Mortierella sp. NVP85]